ncbi:MFS transporter, DHA1 family, arabinose polymer transporter [Andreprevotia lacus DSM 23236]|jgi:DHA1 family inner membrane transport protein|uniref:MFS transporter, DHA1 family, arabinose polymer transporter n=1 Tax=Andreprevotia lacus DSM 23236 TaxID=1121001 RepID=A0A1W1XK34_9NEIS|nr:MFS transporter [Andreprevotia lacus]SMC24346.1 MFS transporter, DHA1 family, arabinose polymer transporter [Andreprevotia lacus DSM 23236]
MTTNARQSVKAELAMGLGGFAIGTGEFVIMGLLPDVASQLQVSVPEAGYVISAYALGVVIGAPVLATLCARWPRHLLLIVLMACFGLGNFVTALSPSLWSMVAIRFIAGLPHGAYFGVAALVAASLVPANQRAQAVGRVMLGLTTATLAGVPLAAWLGQHWGWRAAFVFVGVIAALACWLIHRWVPRQPGDAEASPSRELGALTHMPVLLTLGIGALGFGGVFCVFSYVAPTMTKVAGLPVAWMPAVLTLFGCGMILGNVVGAKLADRALLPAIGGILVWNVAVTALFYFTAHVWWLAMFNILLIGTGAALGPALQVRLMDVANDAQTLAAALNHSAFNIANALGAWLGGAAIAAGLGWTSTSWVGALLPLAGIAIYLLSLRHHARQTALACEGAT